MTLSAKPPPTSSATGASKAEEPVWDPNNPMNRSLGASSAGKKGVREGLPGFGGGGAGESENQNRADIQAGKGRLSSLTQPISSSSVPARLSVSRR